MDKYYINTKIWAEFLFALELNEESDDISIYVHMSVLTQYDFCLFTLNKNLLAIKKTKFTFNIGKQ